MATILIIDDDPQMRRVVLRILATAGHEVIEAKDGKEGLALFQARHPSLVVTDLLMPEKEGIETIRELRNASATLPILAISGGGQLSRMNMFLEAATKLGATARLAKPFRSSDLIETVSRLLAA